MRPEPAPDPRDGERDGGLRGLAVRAAAALIAALLRLWGATWRIDRSEIVRLDRLQAEGTPLVIAFWHEKYLPLFLFSQGRGVIVVTSRSLRGSVLGGISRRFGNRVVFTHDDGHHGALQLLVETLKRDGGLVAIAVDGPLGPRRAAKSGALRIAAELGIGVLPVSFQARPALRLFRRWDRMEVPLPFARVTVRVAGTPIRAEDGSHAALRQAMDALTGALNALDAEEGAPPH